MDIKWLTDRLPPSAPTNRRTEADYYGASELIATALGYDSAPPCVASWKHGVSYERELRFPELILTEGNRATRHLVGNDWQVKALNRRGFFRVHAVGVPFIYVPPTTLERLPRTLLVMPAHSLDNTKHPFDEDEYVGLVHSVGSRFTKIVACIAPPCVRKGTWTRAFERKGIAWIPGADSSDRNALRRMARVFAMFEYVTSNTMGSHIAYSAYSGCKVSIWGPFAEYRQEHFRGVPWYDKNWSKVSELFEKLSESYIRARHPWLFKEPWNAELGPGWAEPFLGLQHKREPLAVARLLGWSIAGQAELPIHDALRWVRSKGQGAMRRICRSVAGGNQA
jgi:hypothetical protein